MLPFLAYCLPAILSFDLSKKRKYILKLQTAKPILIYLTLKFENLSTFSSFTHWSRAYPSRVTNICLNCLASTTDKLLIRRTRSVTKIKLQDHTAVKNASHKTVYLFWAISTGNPFPPEYLLGLIPKDLFVVDLFEVSFVVLSLSDIDRCLLFAGEGRIFPTPCSISFRTG